MAPSRTFRSRAFSPTPYSSQGHYDRLTPLARVPFPMKTPRFTEAHRTLDEFNSLGVMTTWCPYTNDWIPWHRYDLCLLFFSSSCTDTCPRPMRVLKSQKRLVPVAASGFPKIKNLIPPRCPHTLETHLRDSHMVFHHNKIFDRTGTKANFFRATSHSCAFIGGCAFHPPFSELS